MITIRVDVQVNGEGWNEVGVFTLDFHIPGFPLNAVALAQTGFSSGHYVELRLTRIH